MWWLPQFINQNIEKKIKKFVTMIIFGLKKESLLHKIYIPLHEEI